MRELALEMRPDGRPLYLRIAEAVRTAIQGGHARGGEPIPSTRTLARTLGAHRHTVMAALDELVAEGWLVSWQRRMYQVSDALPDRFFSPLSAQAPVAARKTHRFRIARSFGQGLPLSPSPGQVRHSFQTGLPDLRLFPHLEFKGHLSASLRRSPQTALGYCDPAGLPAFVEELEKYLRRMRAVANREIIVTHGSQEAIFLTAQVLLSPGDRVAVEELGYRPAWEALKAAGAQLVPIRLDENGIDTEFLGRVLRSRRIRLIYATPLHQFPTAVTVPASRRLRLYELASRHGVPILEDDYDHEFHYRCQPLPPIASQDPAQCVIYVSTFSKILFPSARLGFLAVPASLAASLSRFRRIMTRQNDALLQDAVARWMRSGGFELHVRRMRRVYQERKQALVDCLRLGAQQGLPISWKDPDGGMAIWVSTGMDSDRVARAARSQGVFVTPESAYRLKQGLGQHLRLGFANQTVEEIREGMALLFRAME